MHGETVKCIGIFNLYLHTIFYMSTSISSTSLITAIKTNAFLACLLMYLAAKEDSSCLLISSFCIYSLSCIIMAWCWPSLGAETSRR
jgi:hypothetical protein